MNVKIAAKTAPVGRAQYSRAFFGTFTVLWQPRHRQIAMLPVKSAENCGMWERRSRSPRFLPKNVLFDHVTRSSCA